jgi:hypothetical protein
MHVTTRGMRVVAAVIAATAGVLVTGTSSVAAPQPPDPVPVSLTCGPGTYSFIQELQLLDHKGNVVGVDNMECGSSSAYAPFGYPSTVATTVSARATGYSYIDSICASDTAVGVDSSLGATPLAKKGPTTVVCTVATSTGSSDVTLTIG